MNLKKTLYKFSKITWIIIGILILAWTIFWYFQMHLTQNLGEVLTMAIFMGIGIYTLIFYSLATILFIIIKFIIKKRKN
ncbi:MAG: hypothetical protein OQK82_01155 [Candidatus Pacearchaeota archaeon]|nr:hypothetical protein [Candidatus Pacearchaeota archaeon]